MNEKNYWIWKDIDVSTEQIGETIKKGSGTWEKEYTYIKIPKGYGYDNYCFLLSDNCVHFSTSTKDYYISINSSMKIELVYDPELRETDKKYKRYKLTGEELFEQVFKDYEINFAREYEERTKKEALQKEKRDKSIIGTIYCGIYEGNVYCGVEPKYMHDFELKSYFSGNRHSTYMNSKFQKVQNVQIKFVIKKNVSRYDFLKYENIINAYLSEIEIFVNMQEVLKKKYLYKTDWKEREKHLGKIERKKYDVKTDTEDILEAEIDGLEERINELKIRMTSRLNELINNSNTKVQ